MKTIEWLEELPEPIKTKALNNLKRQNKKSLSRKLGDYPVDSLKSALKGAFRWSDSPEGLHFWIKVALGKYEEAINDTPIDYHPFSHVTTLLTDFFGAIGERKVISKGWTYEQKEAITDLLFKFKEDCIKNHNAQVTNMNITTWVKENL